ncbi:MAG: hypothetical protein ACXVFT_16995 [Solirubrobacteraceae bacterium]
MTLRLGAALAAVALVVGFGARDDGSPAAPSTALLSGSDARLDATSDAEARLMRRATGRLAAELTAAARCDVRQTHRRFVACVAPALQHAGIGGRTAATLLRTVIGHVPSGRCRDYVLRLQAANAAVGDSAQWLLPLLYDTGRDRRHQEIATQLRLAGGMLERASRAASADVCVAAADTPAI